MSKPLPDIISGLHGVEGYLGLSYYRSEVLKYEEYAEGCQRLGDAREALVEAQAQIDRLRQAVAHKPIGGLEGRFRFEEQRRIKAEAALDKVRQAVAAYDEFEQAAPGDQLDFYLEVARAVREP